ncbi:MAG: ribose-5-phosphate isomerase RpiA [Clostridiaceae bacterium]
MKGKQLAGEKACEYVKEGMVVGLGTGSTVFYAIQKLGKLVKDGLKITCVSTSKASTILAKELGIPVNDFSLVKYVDLTIDGADEVDENFDGIKGGGGALLHEKLVAVSSKEIIWIIDDKKLVKKLGKFPLPVEVIPFAKEKLFTIFDELGFKPAYRMKDETFFITDGGNHIIDLHLGEIEFPLDLHNRLKLMPGVVETGLFLHMADRVIVGYEDRVEVLKRKGKSIDD